MDYSLFRLLPTPKQRSAPVAYIATKCLMKEPNSIEHLISFSRLFFFQDLKAEIPNRQKRDIRDFVNLRNVRLLNFKRAFSPRSLTSNDDCSGELKRGDLEKKRI